MKLQKQYLRLYERYGVLKETLINLHELAQSLDCTHRNAAIVISRMKELGWIDWLPSRGRGARSIIRFLVEPDKIAQQVIQSALSERDIGAAIDELRIYTDSVAVRQRLEYWLLARFGPHSETVDHKRIDTLRLPLRGPVHTLDPLAMNLISESFIASHIFDTLVRKNEYGEVVGNIAHSWETDESRLTWTFHLRKGVYSHNGDELSSGDVVYSMNRWITGSEQALYRTITKHIRRASVVDRYTVRMELDSPIELFLPFLCTVRASILPQGNQLSAIGSPPVGTGPLKVMSMSDQWISLEVFKPYFRERALLDRVEIWFVPEHMAGEPGGGEFESFGVVHNPAQMPGEEDQWQQLSSDVSVVKFITMNSKKAGPLREPEFRKLVVEGLGGSDVPETSVDLEAPLLLLTIPPYQHDANNVADRLRSRGIPVQVELATPDQFKGDVRMQADLILFSTIRDQDEQLRLFDLFHNMAEHLEPHIATDLAGLLNRVTKETDPHTRTDHFSSIRQLLVNKHLLHIVSERRTTTAIHRSIRGIRFNAHGWIDLRGLWFKGS